MGGLEVGLDDLFVAILEGLLLLLVGEEVELEHLSSLLESINDPATDSLQSVEDPEFSLMTVRGLAPMGGGGALALTLVEISLGDEGCSGDFTFTDGSVGLFTVSRLTFVFSDDCRIGLEISKLRNLPLSGLGGASKLLIEDVGDKLPGSFGFFFDSFFSLALIFASPDMVFEDSDASGEEAF